MAFGPVEIHRPLCIKDLIPALDPAMTLVITDGVGDTFRTLPADVSRKLRDRYVEFIKIDGEQLRIVIER